MIASQNYILNCHHLYWFSLFVCLLNYFYNAIMHTSYSNCSFFVIYVSFIEMYFMQNFRSIGTESVNVLHYSTINSQQVGFMLDPWVDWSAFLCGVCMFPCMGFLWVLQYFNTLSLCLPSLYLCIFVLVLNFSLVFCFMGVVHVCLP